MTNRTRLVIIDPTWRLAKVKMTAVIEKKNEVNSAAISPI